MWSEEAVDEFLFLGEDPEILCEKSVACEESFSALSYAGERSQDLYEAEQKSRTLIKKVRPRKIGRPIGKRTLTAKQMADKLMGSLIKNLNKNVLKDHPEKSAAKI